MSWSDEDLEFMRQAIDEASAALDSGEVPVGAVLVYEKRIIGRSGNRTLKDTDPTGHAEVAAIREAASAIGNHRLGGATLYVTLEPCPMCVGAISQARLQRVVFGAYDEKAGSLGSAIDLSDSPALNHRFEVNGGVLQDECKAQLTQFFQERR